MSIAGGVALSVILAFAFTPQMFALTLKRRKPGAATAADLPTPQPPDFALRPNDPKPMDRLMTDLKSRYGPTALITGASDGIGRAFAHSLAAQGFDLVLVARRENVLQGLARDLSDKHGVKVEVIAADLSAPGAVAEVLGRSTTLPIGLLVASQASGLSDHSLTLMQGPRRIWSM